MGDFIGGCLIFLVLMLYVWAAWKTQQQEKGVTRARHARSATPRTLTGRSIGGIVDAIADGLLIVLVEPDEPGEPAQLHMRDRGGLKVGDHVTIEEYDDGTWEPVMIRDQVNP